MRLHYKLAFNTLVQVIGKIITALSTIAITYLIARKFSIGDYGNYTVTLSYISLFYVFTDLGMNATFVKQTRNALEKATDYFNKLLTLRLMLSVLVIFLALAISSLLNYPLIVKLGVIAALGLIITQSLSNTTLAFFQTKIEYKQAVFADSLGAIGNIIFVFLTVQIFSSLIMVILALILGSIVRALVGLYLVRSEIGNLRLSFDQNFWKEISLISLPIGLIGIFSQINAQSDKQVVLLSTYAPKLHLTGQEAAGLYGLAYKIFEVAIVLPTFIMNVAYPLMIEHYQDGKEQLLSYAKTIFGLLLVIGLIGLAVGWLIVPFVVEFLGGVKFMPSVFTTRLLLIGFPIFFVTPLALWLAVTLNKAKETAFVYGFAAIFNLSANLFFVPRFGYNAAAVTTIFSEALVLILTLVILKLDITGKNANG